MSEDADGVWCVWEVFCLVHGFTSVHCPLIVVKHFDSVSPKVMNLVSSPIAAPNFAQASSLELVAIQPPMTNEVQVRTVVVSTPAMKLDVSMFIPHLTFLGVQRLLEPVLQFVC